ncbi:hypothetical protein WICPIJ_004279 [Wickerhamomyces pijperi]|uniref:CP-type G domain-containing protein n=1 Tax=Wickerhamomyces pijperi TaxID=599730 RepID=A0A9P8Q5V8_WICPI|nr:hypothetical protein WICPIJ_004279 [Wickerhamomyces pijperi]
MRLKKPVSKRGTTRMREGIKKKAAAHQRKQKKLSKKDVTWRSKHKKDPGIPASFPYKDRIVNEIEANRMSVLAEKEREKEERRLAREAAAVNGEDMMMDDSDEEGQEGNGLAALLESAQAAAKQYEGESDEDDEMSEDDDEALEVEEYAIEISDVEEDDSEIEKSRKAYDKIFKAVVEASDVVLYVLDARDPEGTRSKRVEEAVLQAQGKRLILILNKVDLIPTDVLKQWMDFLGSSFPTIPLKASPSATNSNSFNKNLSHVVTANNLMTSLKSYAAKSNLKRAITVGVIGYPNVGKSSIINALTSRHNNGSSKACPVGNQAGVTTSLREVKVDGKLKILDSPGIVFPSEGKNKKSKIEMEAQLALLNAVNMKQITDPLPAIQLLLKRLSKSSEMVESFKKFYQLPAIPDSNLQEFSKNFLIHIARTRGRLGKGGIPNLHSAGLSVLNDWRDGKITGWTLPKSSNATDAESKQEEEQEQKTLLPKSTGAQTTIVQEWSKEFDLEALFATLDK